MDPQMCKTIANKAATSEHLRVMESGLPNYLLCNDRDRKEEAHHGSNTMRSPALYVSGRTGERILFSYIAESQNPAVHVPVTIRDAEASISNSSPHGVH